LITGGGTGIGAAIAMRMAQEGARVAVCGRRSGPLEAVAGQIAELGGEALAIPGDITQNAPAIIEKVVSHFGRLDVLVNNAAVSVGLGIDRMTLEDWRRVMTVNLDGAFLMVRHALPHLLASKGNVLHISSISAVAGEFDSIVYDTSKAGLEGFSRSLALELAGRGVRSNVIRPGLILTEAFANMPEEFFAVQIPMIPLGFAGEPADIAAAAAFLCSDEARFITGAVLTIDGGESAE
jgi:NAD(P)-dependent dehydrogenase (short-subunit alcohol dehydrogenase family)